MYRFLNEKKERKKNGKRIRYGESDFGVFRHWSPIQKWQRYVSQCDLILTWTKSPQLNLLLLMSSVVIDKICANEFHVNTRFGIIY